MTLICALLFGILIKSNILIISTLHIFTFYRGLSIEYFSNHNVINIYSVSLTNIVYANSKTTCQILKYLNSWVFSCKEGIIIRVTLVPPETPSKYPRFSCIVASVRGGVLSSTGISHSTGHELPSSPINDWLYTSGVISGLTTFAPPSIHETCTQWYQNSYKIAV